MRTRLLVIKVKVAFHGGLEISQLYDFMQIMGIGSKACHVKSPFSILIVFR